ncbi:Uncharacterised protein [Mycobacteroides abscessus subsp. abscessus]|nr:Uncharacterised protein [Mycobacteroides abscessus subsp. abscessus]
MLHLGYTDITSHPVTPLLTEAGTAAFKKSVSRSLTECTSRRELAPVNCPLLATDQSTAEVTVAMTFTLSLALADGGRLNNTPVDSRAIATAVMTVANEALIQVEWRNV